MDNRKKFESEELRENIRAKIKEGWSLWRACAMCGLSQAAYQRYEKRCEKWRSLHDDYLQLKGGSNWHSIQMRKIKEQGRI